MKRTLNHKSLYHNAFGAWEPFFHMKPLVYETALCAFQRVEEVLKGRLYKLCKQGRMVGGKHTARLVGSHWGLEWIEWKEKRN
jgi:hypothetical protein